MDNKVKEIWFNRLRVRLSYWVAKAYQNSWLVLVLPSGVFWVDFLWHLSNWLSPFPTEEGCLNPVMVEMIRERMGISHEEFNAKIKEIRTEEERKSLGLPPKIKYSTKT